jgi:ribonuclease BN (tRNA processing enzyme)
MRVRFLGTGDAFGSGGRFQTCFLVEAQNTSFLIDCGATAMVAIRQFNVSPNDIDTIFISHLHGDHIGGLPYLILDAHLVSRRTGPLTIVGPPGLKDRLHLARETAFPDSTNNKLRFELQVLEVEPGAHCQVGPVELETFLVKHKCGAPPTALRLSCDGKVICYTGDTEWVDTLIPAANDADLMICECYFFEKSIPHHLNYKTLKDNLPRLRTKRLILTHLSQDMLERDVECEVAYDGLVLEV